MEMKKNIMHIIAQYIVPYIIKSRKQARMESQLVLEYAREDLKFI